MFKENNSVYAKIIESTQVNTREEDNNQNFEEKANVNNAIILPNGGVFQGDLVDGLANGHGRMILPNEEEYRGEFLNGLRHGIGTNQLIDSNMFYAGEWEKDQYQGYGKIGYGDNSYYVGQFMNGLEHGIGTRLMSYRRIHHGEYVEGQEQGNGIYIHSDGRVWVGCWDKGTPIAAPYWVRKTFM